jgi:ParB-like chromosome segregation protein Spo0J
MATSKKRLGTISEPLQPLAIDIDKLHPDPANARKHNVKNIDAIKASLHAYGQRKPVVVQRQGMIVRAGNGTLEAAKALGWTHLAAVVIDEDNATASQFAIADNRTGELAEWDTETLASLLHGMDDSTRQMLAFDESDMESLMSSLEGEEDGESNGLSEEYTQKISAPIYEPKGEQPELHELFDKNKTNQLIAKIQSEEGISDELRDFLLRAASRHTAFHFRKIAEYYAHAPANVQRLMEDSALVVIDWKAAIEGGFVRMTERLGEIADDEGFNVH